MDAESNQDADSAQPLIVLTGAAGRLGIATHRALLDAGKKVLAIDRNRHATIAGPFVAADLSKPEHLHRILRGAGILIHLAYHRFPFEFPHGYPGRTFDEHILLNRRVFQAACEAGVKKIIFSSSIQVVARQNPDLGANVPPRYLPLDEHSPAEPDNWYSLAKRCSEEMLATLHRMYGVDCVILRFPSLIHRGPAPGEILFKERRSEGSSYLTYRDAAEALLKAVDADLPGCRTYLPASRNNGHGRPASELITEFYRDVPLKRPPGTIDSLVDSSAMTRETGWEPRDLEYPEPRDPATGFRHFPGWIRPWLSRIFPSGRN